MEVGTRNIGARFWTVKAKDGKNWREILRKAKTLKGLLFQ